MISVFDFGHHCNYKSKRQYIPLESERDREERLGIDRMLFPPNHVN
jgi:hypothetical protein